jgi:hypothetical protein
MNRDPQSTPSPDVDDRDTTTTPSRLFLFESDWRISVKTDSQRAYCYMRAPGQDFYHSLLDGEIFLSRGEQRYCMSCAIRRGLISLQPRLLPEIVVPAATDFEPIPFAAESEYTGPSNDWRFGER